MSNKNNNALRCKIKTALPMYLDIQREALMCTRISDKINNALYRCYTTPYDISALITACNNNNNNNKNIYQTIDSRSHFIILYITNKDNSISKTILTEFIVEPKFSERDSRNTATTSPVKNSTITTTTTTTTNNNITIQLWFLKEHMDILELVNDQIISINLISKYSLLPIENIYLSIPSPLPHLSTYSSTNNKQDIKEIEQLFNYEWARSGLESGTPLSYSGGNINLFQRFGKIINYNYKLKQPTHHNKDNEIINQFGIINNQTKLIFNGTTNEDQQQQKIMVENNDAELLSYDNNCRIKVLKLLKIFFGNNENCIESKKYMELGISKPRSLLLHGPQSCGKTSIINKLVGQLAGNHGNIKIININLSDLVKYQPNTKGLLLKYYQAKHLNQSILLFDHIDEIFPQLDVDTKNSNQQNLNSLYTCFLNLLNNQIDNNNNNNNDCDNDGNNGNNGLFIIGITNKIKNLNSFIRSCFEEEIKIDPPNQEKRKEIFNWNLKGIGYNKINENKIIIEKINDNCNGLMGGDINILCRNAKIKSLKRYSNNNGGNNIDLGEIEFLENDFIDFENDGIGSQYRKDKTMISKISPSIPKVSWNDIGGLEDAKEVLSEMVIWDYKYSDSIKRLGVQTPKGILMFGPPGTGKTMLAKAVAYEASANFIPINISELIQGEIGESEKILSEIFRIAVNSSPSIIFIDEIQSIFGLKESSSGGNKKLISQLLIELDNCIGSNNNGSDKRVMILAATNMPQAIDPSFLRTGRFDKTVYIGPPEFEERKEIFKTLIKKSSIQIDSTVDIDQLSKYTLNYTGSDINALLKKSGLYAIQRDINTNSISMSDIMKVYWEMKPSVSIAQIDQLKEWEKSRKL